MGADVLPPTAITELDVSAATEANGTAALSITNVAPAGVTTATISKWLKVTDQGVVYYIPMFT
jgi:hypothetical protein